MLSLQHQNRSMLLVTFSRFPAQLTVDTHTLLCNVLLDGSTLNTRRLLVSVHWTDNLLLIRNIAEDTTVEALQELFPDAEEIVVHKDKENKQRKESSSTATPSASATAVGGSAASCNG